MKTIFSSGASVIGRVNSPAEAPFTANLYITTACCVKTLITNQKHFYISLM